MSDPIHISYRWDKDNFEKVFELSYKYLFTHSARRYIGWFFIALLQFGVVAALKQNSFGLLLFSTIVLIYWYYGKKFIAKKRALDFFENSPFKGKTINIKVDKNGFDITNNEGQIHWDWDEIDKVIPLEDSILLYKHPNFYYIPASGFKSLEEKSRFKTMSKEYKKLQE